MDNINKQADILKQIPVQIKWEKLPIQPSVKPTDFSANPNPRAQGLALDGGEGSGKNDMKEQGIPPLPTNEIDSSTYKAAKIDLTKWGKE